MLLNISWDKEFSSLMEDLRNKYGEELFTLDGIGRQVDVHHFAKNFFNNPHSTADVSVDANANVVAKTGIEYNFEMSKPLKRYNSYFLIWKELKKKYGLEYANKVIESQLTGDIYINDFTDVASPYCFNYSTSDIASTGLNGLSKRMKIGAPKSLSTFLRQVEQAMVVMANSTLGATGFADILIVASRYVDKIKETGKDGHVAISDVETYVREKLTEFVYTVNWEFRGNQCESEDTEVLTPDGWKTHDNLKEGDLIYTWKDGQLNINKTEAVNVYDFDGIMHHYSGMCMNQLVTPNHRVLCSFGDEDPQLYTSSTLFDRNDTVKIPVALDCDRPDYDISDDDLDAAVFFLTDGSIDAPINRSPRILWCKSASRYGIPHFLDIMKREGIVPTQRVGRSKEFNTDVQIFRLNTADSAKYIDLLEKTKKKLPSWMLYLSKRQARRVIDLWSKTDGHVSGNIRLQADTREVADGLQILAMIAGYSSRAYDTVIGNNKMATHVVKIFTAQKRSAMIYPVAYKGKVWCPTTKDGIVIFRRNGYVFISGNSPFSNVSIYDKTFLESLCPDYGANKETVKLLQRIYCEVMNREMRRTPLTFPVTTACFAIDENREIKDKEFLKFVAEQNKEFGFINLYNGSTATLSSCCFTGDTDVAYAVANDAGTVRFLQTSFREGYDTYADVPILVFHKGEYVHARFVRVEKTEYTKLYAISFDNGAMPVMTDNHLNPVLDGADKFAKHLTMAHRLPFYTPNGIVYKKPVAIIEVHNNDEYVYCIERVDQTDPYFTLPCGLITHNCRLRSNRNNEYFNSFGAGSSKIGSLGVVTANLPRAAHLAGGSYDDFVDRVHDLFIMAQRINACKRKLVKKRIELGAAPLYTHGYMDLKKQYSTFGIVGVNEAIQLLGGDILKPESQEEVSDLLDYISVWCDEAESDEHAPHNVEQVPAESSAVKLAQKDKFLGMDFGVPLYSNQFIPLTTKADMYDRLRLQGMFDARLSGGAIAHINVGEPIEDTDTLVHLMEYAAKCGVVYWAINYRLYCCPKKHTWVGTEICPVCGEHWENEITRVVGFFTTVKNWNPVRRTEDWPNRQFYGQDEVGKEQH